MKTVKILLMIGLPRVTSATMASHPFIVDLHIRILKRVYRSREIPGLWPNATGSNRVKLKEVANSILQTWVSKGYHCNS